jgi:asparagine synthetase B (glutamine-hydrolysing)
MILAIFGDRAAWPAAELERRYGPPARQLVLDEPEGQVGVWGLARLDAQHASYGVDGSDASVRWAPSELELRVGSAGGRPMYYAFIGQALWISTSLSLLLAHGQARPDAQGLAGRSLFLGASSRTPVVGLSRVPSHGSLRFHRSTQRDELGNGAGVGTWVPGAVRPARVTSLGPLNGDEGALAEALFETLRGAVRRALDLAPGAKVAVMAGGGVDSSGLLAAVLAEARGASAREVETLRWYFGGAGDDRPYMADLSAALGIVPVDLHPPLAASFAKDALLVGAAPYSLVAGAMELATLAAARERGAALLFTGMGGDETLEGVLQSVILGDALCADAGVQWSALPQALARAYRFRASPPRGVFRRVADYVVRPLARGLVPHAARARAFFQRNHAERPWLGPVGLAALGDVSRRYTAAAAPPRTAAERYLHVAQNPLFEEYMDLRGQLEDEVRGVTRVDVYLDDALLRFLAEVPPTLLATGDVNRGLFRAALRGRVPERIVTRQSKANFDEVLLAVLGGAETRARFSAFRDGAGLAALGVVNQAAFRRAVDELVIEQDAGRYSAKLGALVPPLAAEAFLQDRAHAGTA